MSIIQHTPSFIPNKESSVYFETCLKQIPFTKIIWKTGKILPRKGFSYNILGNKRIPILDKLIDQLEEATGRIINGVFCNYYEDGNDHCAPHTDIYGSDLFTLSLGGTRDCLFHPIKGGKSTKYTLKSGDLLYFNLETNFEYKHSIPVRKRVLDSRISILFFVAKD